MQDNNISTNNKRIAKNTLLLYIRMLFIMFVSLFTSRVVLDSLGEENFGTYNVVGGVVSMFYILSGPLSSAIQRFLTFELGTGDKEKLSKIFSTSVNIQLLMSLIVFVICEIVGVWFLHTQMNIPSERMGSADWVLQVSILTFIINLNNIPFNATIISHEKMNIFAYISILEITFKLAIAYAIYVSPIDKLKLYSTLLMCVSLSILLIYALYCKWHYEEVNYSRNLDKPIFKEMACFAGWNFFGNTAYMLNTQGVNMLINVFFGVKINAARAIAVQVDSAIQQFANNFTTAMNPQITKSYASDDKEYLYKLVCNGSKYSFFIMLLLVVPIFLESDTILNIWLKKVPDQSSIFLRLVMLNTLAISMQNSMATAVMATGKVKMYQIKMNTIGSLTFPLTWISYCFGAPAYITYLIGSILSFLVIFIRLNELKRLMDFPVKEYAKNYLSRIFLVAIIAFTVPYLLQHFMDKSILRLFVICVVGLIFSLITIWFVGLNNNERTFFSSKIFLIANIIKKVKL